MLNREIMEVVVTFTSRPFHPPRRGATVPNTSGLGLGTEIWGPSTQSGIEELVPWLATKYTQYSILVYESTCHIPNYKQQSTSLMCDTALMVTALQQKISTLRYLTRTL
jgi:hypothetical protein